MENVAPASEFAPFGIHRQYWPENMADAYRSFASHLVDRAADMAPKTVHEVLLLPRKAWDTKSDFLDVYAFGTFRSHTSTVLKIAELVAPVYLECGILPLIRPLFRQQWVEIVQRRSRLFRRVSVRGLLAFSRVIYE